MGQLDVQRTLRDAGGIDHFLVAGLARPASAWFLDLGMNEVEREELRIDRRRFTQPGRHAIDGEAERAKEPRLAEIVARQRMAGAAFAAYARDQERRPLPGVQDV